MASQSFSILKSSALSIPPFGRPTLICFSPIRPQSLAFPFVARAVSPVMAQSCDGTPQPVEAEVLDPKDCGIPLSIFFGFCFFWYNFFGFFLIPGLMFLPFSTFRFH